MQNSYHVLAREIVHDHKFSFFLIHNYLISGKYFVTFFMMISSDFDRILGV